LATIGTWLRFSGYSQRPDWQGEVLSDWQAEVLQRCAEALLPPAPDNGRFIRIVGNVDRYLLGLPQAFLREIHLMFLALEHGTTLFTGRWSRLTALDEDQRRKYLDELAQSDGLRGMLYRGMRDLCMMGYYQDPDSWPAIGYSGPMVPGQRDRYRYLSLVAPMKARPRSLQGKAD
jgi:D-cysteine desulfhydrase